MIPILLIKLLIFSFVVITSHLFIVKIIHSLILIIYFALLEFLSFEALYACAALYGMFYSGPSCA